jgi:hypothetical protein
MEQVFGGFTVDPTEAVRYDRNDHDLENFWLFCGCVAGKTATTISTALNRFLNLIPSDSPSPFQRVRDAHTIDMLDDFLIEARLGQYGKLRRFMVESTVERSIDLRNDSVEQLETIHGVGPKTARFFVMFTRPGARYAALDTHILKYLRHNGIDAPKITPASGPRYTELEDAFLSLVPIGVDVGKFDLAVWSYYSGHSDFLPLARAPGCI